MNYPKTLWVCAVLLLASACKKEENITTTHAPTVTTPKYMGGKNGWYSRNFFGLKNFGVVPTRAYIKYAADGPPRDTTKWDEAKNSSFSNGLNHHVRFDSLDYGTYFVLITDGSDTAEAIMEIVDISYQKLDVYLPLK